MRAIHAIMFGAALLGVGARAIVGCATSENADENVTRADASGPPTLPDEIDASADEALDADADARKTCSGDGWCHTVLPLAAIADAAELEPATVSIDLRDVWVTADHEAWAVSAEGYVLRWRAGAWHLAFDAKRPLRTVWAAQANDVWIAGDRGLVLHGTEKAGTITFEPVDLSSNEHVLRIRGTSSSDVWAVTETKVHRYSGTTFAIVTVPNGIAHLAAAQQFADVWVRGQELWVGAREFTNCHDGQPGCPIESRMLLLRWRGDEDGGALWERVALEDDRTLITSGALSPNGEHLVNMLDWSTNVTSLAVVAPQGSSALDASAAKDAGAFVWAKQGAAIAGTKPEGVWAAAGNDAWLVASPAAVQRWDGQSWKLARISLTTSPLAMPLHAVSGVVDPAGKSDVWIVGRNIALHRSELP